MFECFLKVLANKSITDTSTQHQVLEAVLDSARNENDIQTIVGWFNSGSVEGHELSLK